MKFTVEIVKEIETSNPNQEVMNRIVETRSEFGDLTTEEFLDRFPEFSSELTPDINTYITGIYDDDYNALYES